METQSILIRTLNDTGAGHWSNHGHFIEFQTEAGYRVPVSLTSPLDKSNLKRILLDTSEALDRVAEASTVEDEIFQYQAHSFACRETALTSHQCSLKTYYRIH